MANSRSRPVTGPLEIRAGGLGRQAARALGSALPLVAMALAKDPSTRPIGRLGCGALGVLFLAAVVRHFRQRAKGCLLRLDGDGLTLTGGRTVGWDEIREVRVVHKGAWEGLVFLPRQGATLPVFFTGLFLLRPRTLPGRLTRQWGSPLVLLPKTLDVPGSRIAEAVRTFGGGVPVLTLQTSALLPGPGV